MGDTIMAKFKVGDKARVVYIREHRHDSWKAGVIVTISDLISGIDEDGDPFDCTVICPDGSESTPLFEQLEPIINESSNWEDIEEITGWNPSKTKVV